MGLLLLTALSGFISVSETALFALTRQDLATRRRSGRMADRAVILLRDDPGGLLWTLMLTSTAVNIVLYSMMAVMLAEISAGSPALGSILAVAGFVVVLLVSEILPKLGAFVLSQPIAPMAAVPLLLLRQVTRPIQWVLDAWLIRPLTRLLSPRSGQPDALQADELQHLLELCRSEGLIDPRESMLLHQVLELSDKRISAVMVPRPDVVAFDLSGTLQELIDLLARSRLMRLPVYEDDLDHVRGMIVAKDLLSHPNRPPRELIRPVHFVPEQATIEDLLRHFRATATQLAMVVDEYGGLAGIIALEDVAEELVGEFHAPDEPAGPGPVTRMDDRTFLIDAGLDLDDFTAAFDLAIETGRFQTVAGWVVSELNRIPTRGDELVFERGRLTVTQMKRRRVVQVRLDLREAPHVGDVLARLMQSTAPQPVKGEGT